MNRRQRLVSAVTRGRWWGPIGRRVATPLDRALHRSRLAPTRLTGMPSLCFVTTIGRHSGDPRTSPLLSLAADGGGLVVVATNWGTAPHPGWSYNMDADPAVAYEIDGVVTPAGARRATPEEYERYWPRFVAMWPNYEVYRDRLERDIRMYVLEPAQPI